MEKAVISDATEYLLSIEANKRWYAALAEAERGGSIEIKLETFGNKKPSPTIAKLGFHID